MEQLLKMINMYVATLRAIYLVHQHCHWTTKGTNFYSNHLLFERLYKKAQEDADLAAEKFIGLFGEESVDYSLQAQFLSKLLSKYGNYNGEHLPELGLKIEKDFLAFSKQVYDSLVSGEVDNKVKETLGLDDMIMSIASSHEEACYLLSQTLDNQ
jgi:DNA-binding ferritin-like protein